MNRLQSSFEARRRGSHLRMTVGGGCCASKRIHVLAAQATPIQYPMYGQQWAAVESSAIVGTASSGRCSVFHAATPPNNSFTR